MNQKMLVFMGMGFELAGLVIGAIYIGKYIDAYFSLQSMGGSLALILACLGVWFYHIVYLLKQLEKNDDPQG